MQNDEQVMTSVRDGNVRQLSVLFDRYYHSLFKYCLAICGQTHIAEDCVQETFRRILQYRQSYQAGPFKLWLFRIARNVTMDSLPQRYEFEADELEDETPGPESLAITAQDKETLKSALQRIRPASREVLVLARYQEFGAREIGMLIGANEGAVRVRLHRALKELAMEISMSQVNQE